MMLIEALIAVLIFSFGILGLIALQANAIKLSTDARYRTDAALLANQLIARLSVAAASDAASYAHRASGDTPCAPSGTESAAAPVTAWLSEVENTLPGAAKTKQQVKVDMANNVVVVTLCWEPNNGSQHRHTVTTQMQWQ